MINQRYISEWSHHVPWKTNEQVEQDLVICRALVEIFQNPFLKNSLAFRGGTALHKLFLKPQARYSEDIDLVQKNSEPIGPVIDELRKVLAFIGKPNVKSGNKMVTMKFPFLSESSPPISLKLKVEINCREHFTVLGYQEMPFEVESKWFSGKCTLDTYCIEELLGTKLRALYQRRKGRDLFDLYKALKTIEFDVDKVVHCYKTYINFDVDSPPSQTEFILNMEQKIKDSFFLGDTLNLLRPEDLYDAYEAYELVKQKILLRL